MHSTPVIQVKTPSEKLRHGTTYCLFSFWRFESSVTFGITSRESLFKETSMFSLHVRSTHITCSVAQAICLAMLILLMSSCGIMLGCHAYHIFRWPEQSAKSKPALLKLINRAISTFLRSLYFLARKPHSIVCG